MFFADFPPCLLLKWKGRKLCCTFLCRYHHLLPHLAVSLYPCYQQTLIKMKYLEFLPQVEHPKHIKEKLSVGFTHLYLGFDLIWVRVEGGIYGSGLVLSQCDLCHHWALHFRGLHAGAVSGSFAVAARIFMDCKPVGWLAAYWAVLPGSASKQLKIPPRGINWL